MATQSAVIYSALLLASAAAHQVSSTPPKIAQQSSNHLLDDNDKGQGQEKSEKKKTKTKQKKDEALHETKEVGRNALLAIAATRCLAWTFIGLEVVVRLMSLYPANRLSATLLPLIIPALRNPIGILVEPRTWQTPTLTSAPSPALYFSALALSLGFALRLACFRTMGRHFSFLHTTLAGHRLVSSGPYAVVRHPSYTGECLVRFGMLALLLRPDGVLAASGALPWAPAASFSPDPLLYPISAAAGWGALAHAVLVGMLRVGIAFYAGWISFACPYLLLRAPKEDATLRATFGKEWEDYAARVPWRFVPYVA